MTAKKAMQASSNLAADDVKSAAQLISRRIADVGDWRGNVLRHVRKLIMEADPYVTEEVKWRKPSNPAGVPVWSHDGMICTGETYKQAVKLTFAKGAALSDPAALFNSSLDGNVRRAIDIHEGDEIDESAFKDLIRAAVALNLSGKKNKAKPDMSKSRKSATKSKSPPKAGAKTKRGGEGAKPVKLLSGGNPQIAKADGEAPVRAYIAAMPGWKRKLGERVDAIIARTVPNVRKAVKWNSPFYGIEGQGWFMSFHVFTRYVKVTFFSGMSLRPLPPGASKHKDVRYVDLHEGDFDEGQMAAWVKQAAALPGWEPGRSS